MSDVWTISIRGNSGMHGRGATDDADRLARQFAERLRNAGHQIDAAEFCVIEGPGVKADQTTPAALLDGVPTVRDFIPTKELPTAAAETQTTAVEAGPSGGPRNPDAASTPSA